MSLLVWLPLTRDLTQQGTSDITVSNNGAAIYNSGKLGKCYYFDGNAHWLEFSKTVGDLYSRDFSYAVWLKPVDNTRGVICSEYSSSGSSNVTFELTAARVVRLYWAGSPDLSPSACTLTKDVWSHVAITRSGNVAKFYINGVLKYTYSGTLANKTTTAKIRLGDDYRGGTSVSYMGYMNDFRIYDHCLSPKEVELLSRGLVAHYTLTGNGRGVDNILAGTVQNETTYTYPSSSYSDKWSKKTSIVPAASKYTLSFWAKSTVNGDKIRSHYYNPNTTTKCESNQGVVTTSSDGLMDYTLSTEWKKYWCVYTQNSTTATKTIIFPRMNSTAGSGTVSIKNVKFEEGDKSTSWLPNSADSAYDTLGYNNTIEYDCSGYQNNMTKAGTISYTSDSAKYSIASHFINGSYLMANQNCTDYLPKDAITVNLWVKPTTWANPISCTESGGWNFEGDPVKFPVYISGVGYKTAVSNVTGANLQDGKWHMLTGTFDSVAQEVKIYVDGVLKATTATGSSNGIGYASNRLIISGEAQSTTPASSGFVGEESDVRIYATALTADQIKELYQSGATITNSGALIGYELAEV